MEKPKRQYVKVIIPVLALILLFLFLSVWYRIDTITVTGNNHYTDEDIKQMIFTSVLDENQLILSLKNKFVAREEIPFIQKIDVINKGHHGVKLRVYEKSLVACVKYMNQYIYFDKDGIVLECSEQAIEGIPYVTGIEYQGFTLYEKLTVEDNHVFACILDLAQLIQKYKLPVNRIHFSEDETVMLEAEGIKTYLGKREFYDEQMVALSEVLPQAIKEKLKGRIYMENYQAGDNILFHKE